LGKEEVFTKKKKSRKKGGSRTFAFAGHLVVKETSRGGWTSLKKTKEKTWTEAGNRGIKQPAGSGRRFGKMGVMEYGRQSKRTRREGRMHKGKREG